MAESGGSDLEARGSGGDGDGGGASNSSVPGTTPTRVTDTAP